MRGRISTLTFALISSLVAFATPDAATKAARRALHRPPPTRLRLGGGIWPTRDYADRSPDEQVARLSAARLKCLRKQAKRLDWRHAGGEWSARQQRATLDARAATGAQ